MSNDTKLWKLFVISEGNELEDCESASFALGVGKAQVFSGSFNDVTITKKPISRQLKYAFPNGFSTALSACALKKEVISLRFSQKTV